MDRNLSRIWIVVLMGNLLVPLRSVCRGLNILHRINFPLLTLVTAPEFKGKGYARKRWSCGRIIDRSI